MTLFFEFLPPSCDCVGGSRRLWFHSTGGSHTLMHEIRRRLKATTCCKVLSLRGVFDFEKHHSCVITKSLFHLLSYPVCSIHDICYFTMFTYLLDTWWWADSGIAASDFPCQAMGQILTYVHVCMCVHVHVYAWVHMKWTHLYHVCTTYVFFFFFSAMPNIAETLEIQDGAGGSDGLLTAGPDAGPCRPVTCILTHACTREYPCIGTSVCRDACVLPMCVLVSEAFMENFGWQGSQLAWSWSLLWCSQQFPFQAGTLNLCSRSQCFRNNLSMLKRQNYRFKAEA